MTAQDLILGTVQLGTLYGIANTSGMPDEDEAIELIRVAVARGIGGIDTARGYDKSEERIGSALASVAFKGDVVTKLRAPEAFNDETPPEEIERFVRDDINTSRSALRQETLDCVLLHRARHLSKWNGKIWSTLQDLVNEGQINRLGVSVQTVAETKLSLETKGVSHIQLAHNILDWRWREAGIDEALRERPDVTVHARSIYLQGLLVAGNPSLFPVIDPVDAEALVAAEQRCASDLGRHTLSDLCLAYIRSLDWIDGLVIGMETMAQLQDNLDLFNRKPLTRDERTYVETMLPRMPEKLLNPGLWKK